MRKILTGLSLIAGLSVSAFSASAMVVTANTQPFEVDWSCTLNTGCNGNSNSTNALTGKATFSNFVFNNNGTSLTFDITITNTTAQQSFSTSDWDSIRLTSFGWDTVPDPTSASETGASVFTGVALETTFPGFQKVDVCAYSGNNCSGGANDGLVPQGTGTPYTDSFAMTLSGFTTGTTSVDFGTDVTGGTELFDVKFQTAFGSFEFQNQPSTPPSVPEPATLGLFGIGLAATGWLRRRRNA